MKQEEGYRIGNIVYLTTDTEQKPRMIIDIIYRISTGKCTYIVACGEMVTEHEKIELSETKLFNF